MRRIARRVVVQDLAALLATSVPVLGKAAELTNRAELFDSLTLGPLRLPNRMVMAPLTRGRAGETKTANALMAEYYAQRADAGLIVSEATAVSPQGYGWIDAPAIYGDSHVRGWRLVTDAVHRLGGRMYLQLWHMGRLSHPDFLAGHLPVAPSPIAASGHSHTPFGKKPYVTPRALTLKEIEATVGDYANAARRAKAAGFDGVEIHAGYGYLIDQFICDSSNRRTDEYGGSVENRLRLLIQVTQAVARVWSPDRIGIRLTPARDSNGAIESHPLETFIAAATALNELDVGYLHVVADAQPTAQPGSQTGVARQMRAAFAGRFILNGGYDVAAATAALRSGWADAIAFGRAYLANPDLVARFRKGAPLNSPDMNTYYGGGASGYTDYPRLRS